MVHLAFHEAAAASRSAYGIAGLRDQQRFVTGYQIDGQQPSGKMAFEFFGSEFQRRFLLAAIMADY
jgi:hypothetical protein